MSGGSLCSFIQVAPPGTGVPLHIHHQDDEFFYLLEGSLRILAGDEAFTMQVGDTVLLPKGKPHAFLSTGEQPAHVLMTLSLSAGSDYESMFAGLVGLGAHGSRTDPGRLRRQQRRVHHAAGHALTVRIGLST